MPYRNHDLGYNLSWRTLTDPSQMSSRPIRRQLGHGLLSSLKYTFKIDRRNSPLRPTQGYVFVSVTQIGGLIPDYQNLRFFCQWVEFSMQASIDVTNQIKYLSGYAFVSATQIGDLVPDYQNLNFFRQEFDLRFSFPLGFYHAALNFGVSGGVIFPWGSGSSLPERFFLGGNSFPFFTLGGPMTLLGFKSRGLRRTEPSRKISENSNDDSSDTFSGRDFLGGDLALSAFVDISFDLLLRVFREAGIHGHVFASAGNLAKLTENAFRDFSLQKFRDSYRSSAGLGIIVPTKLFRMEVNYCYILKQLEHDCRKTGVQFSLSSPL